MKKKILLFIFALFIGLFGLNEIKAETTCLYETDYGIIKIKLGMENDSKVYFINKLGKEILWNKSYSVNFSDTCPDDISVVNDSNNKLWVLSGGFKFLGVVSNVYTIDNQSTNIDSCKYSNDDIFLHVPIGNATTTQPVIITTFISPFPQLEKLNTQVNATIDFGAGDCPSNIYSMIYGWNENSTIIDGQIYDYKVLRGVKHYINSSKSSKLMKGVFCGAGKGAITDIPTKIPELTSTMFTIVQVAVPIILVIMGSLDLFKGITSGKEDEMKKGRQMFIKRLVIGAIIFLVVIIVKLIISVVADTGVDNMIDCIDCFISNDCGGM